MDMHLLLKQAQQIQARIQEVEQNLRVEGTSGGAMVKVILNGAKELISISISKAAIDGDDLSMLEDLITTAFHDASTKVNNAVAKSTGGFNGI